MKTNRKAVWILVLGLLVFNLVRGAISLHLVPLSDFVEYWAAGRVFLSGGNPYSAQELLAVQGSLGWVEREPLMMWNPPWTLPLVAPLALMPYWVARGVWFLLSLVLLFACADFLWSLYGGPGEGRWLAWLTTLFFVPDAMALYLGQIAPLILAGLAGFLFCLRHGRPWLAGACLFLLALKPHLLYLFWILLLLWVFKERQWKVAAGLSLTGLALVIGAAAVNRAVIIQYLEALGSDQGPLRWQTPSLGTALRMAVNNDGGFLALLPMLCGLAAVAWLWCRWKERFDWRERLPGVVLLSVVTTSFSWTFDWVLLLPAVILMMAQFVVCPRRNWWLLAGLVLVQGGLFLQLTIVSNYFYTVWFPPAIAILFGMRRSAS